jgi:hypothetical protein
MAFLNAVSSVAPPLPKLEAVTLLSHLILMSICVLLRKGPRQDHAPSADSRSKRAEQRGSARVRRAVSICGFAN